MYGQFRTRTSLALLLVAALVSGCVGTGLGDFCDIGEYMDTDVVELGDTIVRLDRSLAERMRVNNLAMDRCIQVDTRPTVGHSPGD